VRFAVCIRNDDHPASLETRKLYRVLPDRDADLHGLLRVIGKSGEDYLYPADVFALLALPREVEEALLSLA
jgi:hypothetical protein